MWDSVPRLERTSSRVASIQALFYTHTIRFVPKDGPNAQYEKGTEMNMSCLLLRDDSKRPVGGQ
jgi:hypothetical protein